MSTDQAMTGTQDQRLIKLLETVMPHYGRVVRQALSEIDNGDRLTIPQFRAMQAINRAGTSGALNLALARQLGVAAPSMTAMIDGLVERGFVDRSIDPSNRRQVIIVLTDSGVSRFQEIGTAIERRLAEGLQTLREDEQEELLKSLQRLDTLLNALPDGTSKPSG